MTNKDELTIELAKNKADKYVIAKELEKSKEMLITDMNNGLGDEILKALMSEGNKPIKIRKPIADRIRNVMRKINHVLSPSSVLS